MWRFGGKKEEEEHELHVPTVNIHLPSVRCREQEYFFWLAIGSLSGSTGTTAVRMDGHGMESGFDLGGIVRIFPTLAIVAIVTAIVAPIKQRLLNKRRPNVPARGTQVAAPAA